MSEKLIDNKELMKEWNYERNKQYIPSELTIGSSKKVWWKCKYGHEWEAVIHTRVKGVGCPYCMGKKAIKGKNDFATLHPEMLNEWDYEENSKLGIFPDDILIGSQKKVNWICKEGHKYERSIYDRLHKRGNCPYCSNRKVLQGYNDFATTNPDLLKEWDYEENNKNGIYPNKITNGGKEKVSWKCSKGHKWKAIIRSRIKGSGCPYCSNNLVLEGYNDLVTTNPEILKYWNYEKNESLSPKDYSHGSTKKVWWKCEKGHEWQAKISELTRGNRCPICANQKILSGYNDLQTQYPDIVQYWNYEKNIEKPSEIAAKSNKKYWWKCPKGHSYQMVVNAKTRGNYHSCPICNKYKRVSVPEKIIYFYLKKRYDNIIENYKAEWLNQKEIDMFIPEINTGIEYDGFRYHQSIKEDLEKDKLCDDNNIKLIRIREKECPDYESSSIKIKITNSYSANYNYISEALEKIEKVLNIHINVNIERDLPEVLKIIDIGEKNNCIAITNPEILDEWDYEKNEKMNITPYNVTKGTPLKAYFICEKGHSYKAAISMKTEQHTGCPYCNGRKILSGYNDLATIRPDLVKEWDYEKNDKNPQEVSATSIKKVWWKCEKGHEYQASISSRLNNCNCPYCSGHQTLTGFNDIKSLYPKLLEEEWDYEKNNKLGIFPEKEKRGSEKKVWWKCKKGHSYCSKINARIGKGTGCPYCANKKILIGYNDLASTNHELLKEWDYEKNKIKPTEVSNGSDKKVWWKCERGHSYETSIVNRKNGQGCPYCSGNKVLVGFNDLATTHPEVLDRWDYEKNQELGITPQSISKSYSKKVWWKCSNGHSYLREVYNQRKGKGRCPICREK